MKATDIKPNRYEFAKATIEAFLKKNPKANIMLVAFTSNPLLLSPPTTDHELILTALKSLNPEHILTKGTSLEKLFQKIASFEREEKNVLLISDGGEEKKMQKVQSILNKNNINLTILALGTTKGTTVKKNDGTLLKTKEGHLVISRINPYLKELSANYIEPLNSAEETAKLLNKNFTQEEKLIKKLQHHYSELYQLPLFLALVLFLLVHTKGIKYLLILFTLLGIPLQASFFDNLTLSQAYESYEKKDFNSTKKELKTIDDISLQSQYALGNTHYNLQEYKQAIKVYKSIYSTKPSIKQKLYYNRANAHAMLKEYDKAKTYYSKSLQLGFDKDAEYNLKLIALLEEKAKAKLGIANPKSQNSESSKSEEAESSEEKKAKDSSSSASGSSNDGANEQKKNKIEKQKLLLDQNAQEEQHPLSSKVYELINKGYIHETQPW
jgi:Ca-activated chloride channel family protein